MDSWFLELRLIVRAICKSPRFAAVAIVTLALGIGAATVMFSAVYGILIAPFPYKNADRLVTFAIHDVARPKGSGRGALSMSELVEYREQNHVFEDIMGEGYEDVLYTAKSETRLLNGGLVTGNMMDFLGVAPLLGRPMGVEDARPDALPVFALSYRGWSEHFNRDRSAIGQAFTLNGVRRTLIAVMPPRYLPGNADVWMPIAFARADVRTDGVPVLFAPTGRLKRGAGIEGAAADLTLVATRYAAGHPGQYPKQFTIVARTATDAAAGNFRGMLYALIAAVALLLLMACGNVANLLLARATSRAQEIAIRAALGASRRRLVVQLLTESLVVSLAGGGLGCLFAVGGVKTVAALLPPFTVSSSAVIAFRPIALAFALAVSVVTTVLSGLAPAAHAVSGGLNATLAATSTGAGGGSRARGRLRDGLVIVEVAMSVVLLVGAGLMMRTVFALHRVDLGFNPRGVFVSRLPFPKGRYQTANDKRIFFTELLDRIRRIPGVVAVATTASLPVYSDLRSNVSVPGAKQSERRDTLVQLSSEDYARTLGLRLIHGRMLSRADTESARRVAVVNELFARRFFDQGDPIGRTLRFDVFDRFPDAPHDAYFEVVGVVSNASNQGIRDPPMPEAIVPFDVTGAATRGILVRSAAEPAALATSLRREVFAMDPNIGLTNVGTLEDFLRQLSYATPTFGLLTVGAFAVVGLILVTVGVFSVMAYAVASRTREFGIRMALGGQARDVIRMVMTSGLSLLMLGSAIGVAASVALARLMTSQIWGVSPSDPLTLVGVVALTTFAGSAACILPARRAVRVDPAVALRHD
jgi:putative ABC transport system permease protein